MSTRMQRESTLTKENYPNNQQTCYVQDKLPPEFLDLNKMPEYDHAIGDDYSGINFLEATSVTVDEAATYEFEVASNNITASDFQDAICGEPMTKQVIRLDFTPIHGIDDNEEVSKRCYSFWEFLKERTELHHLIVLPEKQQQQNLVPKPKVPPSNSEGSVEQLAGEDEAKAREMSATDWMKREDIMNNAIRTLEQRHREQFNEDYCDARDREHRDQAARKRRSRVANLKPPSTTKVKGARGDGRSKSVSSTQSHSTGLYDVEELASQMKAWDLQHTKSMDPPHFPFQASEMTMLQYGAGDVNSDRELPNTSCCKLSCIPECPSAGKNTNSERL